ncbi:MAG TPA: adenylate/guanylate cyclase domain-containing protein [Pirellulales bacterium]|nr:adenylate/guanylate cyclase domain-containing protein [Pirellulales bacterium]
MAELIAEAAGSKERWQRELRAGSTIVLGKDGPDWAVPWERWISRHHVKLVYEHDRLSVRRLPEGRNPVFFHGHEADDFEMRSGECFVIGGTVFTFNASHESSPQRARPAQEYSIGAEQLRNIPFRDAPHRIDVLGHLSNVISGLTDRNELYVQTVSLLLEGIRRANAIAVVEVAPDGDRAEVKTLCADHRLTTGAEVQPSRRLVREAIQHLKKSVVHVWSPGQEAAEQLFTMRSKFDWAFCTPLHGESCQRLGLYVTGQSAPEVALFDRTSAAGTDLDEDVKFAELVATILSSLLEVKELQHRQDVLSHFFSPRVLPLLTSHDSERTLRPEETDITVMFCDLRGFSRKVEAAGEALLPILERVSRALGVMSHCILEHSGAVADFLGDSAMGFWGWPLRRDDDSTQACLAALAIRETFDRLSRQSDHPLAGFMAGVGIASGHAVAGQIGSQDQAKVTVFGPCVNLASRLEGLTKTLRVPVLLDEATASVVKERIPNSAGRLRKLALVKPQGLKTPVMVSELLPPVERDGRLSDDDIAHYEAGLAEFLRGNWAAAYERLHRVPAEDRGKDLLMSFILKHDHTPPPDWDGVIAIEQK